MTSWRATWDAQKAAGAQELEEIRGAWVACLRKLAATVSGCGPDASIPHRIRISHAARPKQLDSRDGPGRPALSFVHAGSGFELFLQAVQSGPAVEKWTVALEPVMAEGARAPWKVSVHYDVTGEGPDGTGLGRGACSEPALHAHLDADGFTHRFRFPLAPMDAGRALEWVLACLVDLPRPGLEPEPW